MAPGPIAALRFTKVHYDKTFIETEHNKTWTTLWNLSPVWGLRMFFVTPHYQQVSLYVSLAASGFDYMPAEVLWASIVLDRIVCVFENITAASNHTVVCISWMKFQIWCRFPRNPTTRHTFSILFHVFSISRLWAHHTTAPFCKQGDSSPQCIWFPRLRLSFTFPLHLLLWAFVMTESPSRRLFFVLHRLISEGHIKRFMTEVLPSGTVRLSRDSGGVDTHQIWPRALSEEQHGQSKMQGKKKKRRKWQRGAVKWGCCQMTSAVKNPVADEQKTEIHLFFYYLLRFYVPHSNSPHHPKPVSVSLSRSLSVKSSGH